MNKLSFEILIFCILQVSAIATSRVPSRHTRSADDIVLSLIVDNSIEVWIDGTSQGTHSGWQSPMTVTLPDNPGVLAFKAHNSGGPAGVLASLTNGMVTEAREWRCTTNEPSGDAWKSGGFDDSSWSIATEFGDNGVSPWGLMTDIAAASKWIWTSDNNAVGDIYCRIRIGVEVLATCDNTIWVYADGIDYTTTSTSSSNADWTVSEYYILPRGTEVFGIKCTNAGGPSGIIASVYNGPVTDEENWKCTHDPTDGWSTLGYNDSYWDIPQHVGNHGDSPWGNLQNPYPISLEADWIWTQTYYEDVSDNHHTTYCRVSIETPITCWDHYTDMNAVDGLVTSVRTQDRPNSFYFGDMGDDVEACAGACARESNCHAYTLFLSTYSDSAWQGQCYGRDSSDTTLVSDSGIDTGIKTSCSQIPDQGSTVSSCSGLPNGNYQSSVNCNEYITCYYGDNTTNTCPENQYWDDSLGSCSFTTSTCTDACSVGPCQHGGTCEYTESGYSCSCPINVHGDNCETVTIPTGQCITDCSGVANGNYQSCSSCSVYATCTDGVFSDNHACADGAFWDDAQHECVAESQTCQDYCLVDSRTQCSTDSDGQTNCEYLGCCWEDSETPNCFHSTENAASTDPELTCSIPLNDRVECGYYGIGRDECLGYGCCFYTQDDGPWCYYGEEPTVVPVGQPVSNCDGLANGNYQSDTNCNSYVACFNGDLLESSCPDNQFWDDESESCGENTTTCEDACTVGPCENGATCITSDGETYTCSCASGFTGSECELIQIPTGQAVTSCTDVENGFYHSSTSNCNQYIQCNDSTATNHNCPANQFFDDVSDACGLTTTTCEDTCTEGPCQNGATCEVGDNGAYVCQCADGYDGTDCEFVAIETGQSISNCTDIADGNYMSDTNCNEYITCTDQSLTTNNCPANEFWDDSSESCETTVDAGLCTDACTDVPCQNGATCNYVADSYSCTCAEGFSGTTCDLSIIPTGDPVTSCVNVVNGNYTSSTNCNEYVECDNDVMTTHTCPVTQFWDDAAGSCQSSTSTCEDVCTVAPCQNGGTCGYQGDDGYECTCTAEYGGTNCELNQIPTGDVVTSCSGVVDGSYHSDVNCNEYVVCSNQSLSLQTCSSGTFWDDAEGECGSTTSTCEDDCTVGPCENGGTCFYGNSDEVGDNRNYTCSCADGFTGDHCETGNQGNAAQQQGGNNNNNNNDDEETLAIVLALLGAMGIVVGGTAAGCYIRAAGRRKRDKEDEEKEIPNKGNHDNDQDLDPVTQSKPPTSTAFARPTPKTDAWQH